MLAIEIQGLTKVYDNHFQALKGIDFKVEQGDFFALLGPNGAGKSTTIGILASLVNKTSGMVKVFGYDLDLQSQQVKESIGLVPQEFNFNVFEKVENILIQQAGYYGIDARLAKERAEKYLRKLELYDKRHEMAKNLSGGMKRRLLIARAMIHEPRLLILDEPTAGVDVEIRHSLWTFIKEINAQGTTIVLTTHYLEEVEELCHNLVIIDEGRMISQSSIKDVLDLLDQQTFVLDLIEGIDTPPQNHRVKYFLKDRHSLEVTVPKLYRLNDLFQDLDRHNVKVSGMRNKGNRLESLFIKFVSKGSDREHKE